MTATAQRRLLILDDDALVGCVVESIAQLAGLETRLTREPDDFYKELQTWQPTHVVLDLTMPHTSGEEVLDALAARGCQARIIVTSGAESDRLARALAQARRGGLDVAGSLSKPFAAAALRALLA